MKKASKFAIIAVVFLMQIFSCIGFASVVDTLEIQGEAHAAPPKIVFITSAEYYDGNGSASAEYVQALLISEVTLGNSRNDSVRIQVKMKNNTPYKQRFDGIVYDDALYDNHDILISTEGLKRGDEIGIGEEITFYANFSYLSDVGESGTLRSTICFNFVLSSEYIDEALIDGAVERFDEILNNENLFNHLNLAMLNATAGGRPNDDSGHSYIGNVIGSSGADAEAVRKFFTVDGVNYLTLEIDGKKKEVTTIIKREDLDGDGVAEMTLYLTANTPTGIYGAFGHGGRDWLYGVYAAVFRVDGEGNWHQLTDANGKGMLVEGQARCTVYSGVPAPQWYAANDSFVTETWRSTNGRDIRTVIRDFS